MNFMGGERGPVNPRHRRSGGFWQTKELRYREGEPHKKTRMHSKAPRQRETFGVKEAGRGFTVIRKRFFDDRPPKECGVLSFFSEHDADLYAMELTKRLKTCRKS